MPLSEVSSLVRSLLKEIRGRSNVLRVVLTDADGKSPFRASFTVAIRAIVLVHRGNLGQTDGTTPETSLGFQEGLYRHLPSGQIKRIPQMITKTSLPHRQCFYLAQLSEVLPNKRFFFPTGQRGH